MSSWTNGIFNSDIWLKNYGLTKFFGDNVCLCEKYIYNAHQHCATG